jgi:tetratricopeptide (TPR) repeat protein
MNRHLWLVAVLTASILEVDAEEAQKTVNYGVMPEVEAALLKEDWAKVAELLPDGVCSDSPVARMIKGHACLALNRNNESLGYFVSAGLSEDRAIWQAYAKGLKRRNSKSIIVDYIVGDSLARLGKYQEAITVLSPGSALENGHYLSVNAKGVCQALLGSTSGAKKCFEVAYRLSKRSLSDAVINSGMVHIHECDGVEGAIKEFNIVLSQHPENALALHGLAMMKCLQGNNKDATNLQAKACVLLPSCQLAFEYNLFLFFQEESNREAISREQYAKNSGTYFDTKFSDVNRAIANFDKNDNYFSRLSVAGQIAQMERKGTLGQWTSQASSEQLCGAANAVREQKNQDANGASAWKMAAEVSHGVTLGATTASLVGGGAIASHVSGVAMISGSASGGMSDFFKNSSVLHGNSLATIEQSLAKMHMPDQTEKASALRAKNLTESQLRDGTYQPFGIPNPTRSSVSIEKPSSGGANLGMKHVFWDDGNWPFKPIYGLGYGISSVDMVSFGQKPDSVAK